MHYMTKRRVSHAPSKKDYELMCQPLLRCPHCNWWAVIKGYVCRNCGEDAGGRAVDLGGECSRS